VIQAVLCRMIVRIEFTFLIILNLHNGRDSLLTEGDLVSSRATSNNPRSQVDLIYLNDLVEFLCRG
jgi:hypothetical protein